MATGPPSARWGAAGRPLACLMPVPPETRNESAPISALVVLRQGKENRLRSLTRGEAFARLFPEVTVHRWDPDFVQDTMDTLLAALDALPVYLLECRPDREAVELLREQMQP